MKSNFFGILGMLSLALLISAPSLSAQTIAKVSVPFSFTVGRTEMSAGNYVISSVSDTAIAIWEGNGKKAVMSLFRREQPGSTDGPAKLVFHKYGDKYFLSQVDGGFGRGIMQLPTSNREKEAQIQTACSASQKEVSVGAK